MNSYLYAINYKSMINQIEKENMYRKSEIKSNEYKFNNYDSNKNIIQNDDNSTNLNTDSPLTDNTIPSPPSSLNLVSLSRCPSPPAPLTINPYIIKNDFQSTESSEETNQFKNILLNEKSNLDFSQQKFRQKFFQSNNYNNNNNKDLNINSEESLLSSIDFIRFYLDKFDTQINQSCLTTASNSKEETNKNMNILNGYLSQSNAEEIIESTIEIMRNFKPVHDRPKY